MYRLHIQAQWPLVFETMAGVIAYLCCRDPLWYMLEERSGDEWTLLVSSAESRVGGALIRDPGVAERS